MRKKQNDHDRFSGIRPPVSTQIASNPECLPAPHTPGQRKVDRPLKEWPAQRRWGPALSRRGFLAGICGMAMAFMAINEVFGSWFRVDAEETHDLAAYPELWPRTEHRSSWTA